ncbi:MAG TPA: hypothetical protein PLY23_01105, partial [Alphaproteobacteria bacterium]|nr:hypothetical protein [Alphaproteobacteria bacterium]
LSPLEEALMLNLLEEALILNPLEEASLEKALEDALLEKASDEGSVLRVLDVNWSYFLELFSFYFEIEESSLAALILRKEK